MAGVSDKKKLIHAFFGLGETVHVTHGRAEFRIVLSRPNHDVNAPISAVVEAPADVSAAEWAPDPVWTEIRHGSERMYYRLNVNTRLARGEIILAADPSWRFRWDRPTPKFRQPRARLS